jgi:hypothetical protein
VQKACKVSKSEKPNESEEFNNVQHMALKLKTPPLTSLPISKKQALTSEP